MELSHRISTRHAQQLAVTSQVIQSIKILQYGQDELEKFLHEQVERNPLIDFDPGAEKGTAPSLHARESHAAAPGGSDEAAPVRSPVPRTSSFSGSAGGPAGSGRGDAFSRGDMGFENFSPAPVTLGEHLERQAGLTFRDATDKIIAVEIIGSLDSDGYLRRDLADIARRLGTTAERVGNVLGVVQGFDPSGIAARDLAECLMLQLRETGRLDPPMQKMLENLPLLASFEHKQLSRLCGVDIEDIAAMAQKIKRLDPRPGRQFDTSPTQLALPDVYVSVNGDGSYKVDLNTALLPRVLVNREYYAEITSNALCSNDKRFVVECMRNANWLVKNLDQRANTILKVAAEITSQQTEFFEKGVEYLRPLKLKDIASVVGVHESTVCRAISNKYMMTNRGMFELKYFFANSISSVDGGSDHSSEMVRHKISALIGAETANTVLSDEAIVLELRKTGVDIARRTIAKYRETMNIPSSLQRRRQKMVQEFA